MPRIKSVFGSFTLCTLMGLAWAATGSQAVSNDWPQWRGPNRDDVSRETGLLKEWPTGGPNLLWERKGLGAGFSSVAIAGGKIYTMGDRSNSSYVICLNAADGKEIWASPIGKIGGDFKGTRATPTVDTDLVFALGQFGDLVCVERGTGKELWRKNFKKDWEGKEGDNWGCSESPLVDGDRVIVTPGGRKATMVALNKKTGAEIWKGLATGNPSAGHSSIVIGEVGGLRQYINLTGGGVVAFNAKDGKFLWIYEGSGKEKIAPNTANIPTCIVHGDQVYCAAGYGKGGALLKMTPDGEGVKVEQVYFARELTNKHGGLVLVGDYLYGDRDDSGHPQCIDCKTGKVVWQRKEGGAGHSSAAVAYADERLYIRYANAVMALVEAGPKEYKEFGSFKIPHNDGGNSWAHPVVSGGKLYVREQDWLMCYDVSAK